MSSVAEWPEGGEPVQATLDEDVRYIGVATRAVSWVYDALVINLAAIIAGIGAALVVAIFPVSTRARPALEAIAGVGYGLWCAAYFVLFWSLSGQTPGARFMQIRLVASNRQRVKPARALVRWVGMNLAMLPLFAGYLPILFRRRGFPDWLAHTLVLDAPPMALDYVRREAIPGARDSSSDALRPARDGRESRSSIYEVPGRSPRTVTIAATTDQRQGQPRQISDPSVAEPSTDESQFDAQPLPPSGTSTATS
jgi:uncharacterized RDD family membrane protein YckC